jgi:predicted nucleic acid-binding protein
MNASLSLTASDCVMLLLAGRIVDDTNTVTSGQIWQGLPCQIINAARAGTITLRKSARRIKQIAIEMH